ncbi:MAG: tetratricopeptide repeat protein [candidate division SR1 bacterium]|nr:tetratricopeptide repeat protein [candidate division SR1 bacterium]
MNTPAFNSHKISEALEHRPFNDFADQEFFAERCKVHDNLCPYFLPREEREALEESQILEKWQDQLALFLPQDLQLWEIMDIIRKVDQDTFKRKAGKQNERADQLYKLGGKFEKAGLYIANFFPSDDESQEAKLAQDLAQQFYSYGCSLQQKTRKSDALHHNISLSEEEVSEVDQRLLGKKAYTKRLARLGENPSKEQLDGIRKELLTTAFKALKKDASKEQGEKPRELKKGPYYKFQEKVQSQILKTIQMPETELYTAIFRRGMENLISNMPAPGETRSLRGSFRKDLGFELINLTDALKLPTLKAELEKVRQTGDKSLISVKELEIAKRVQEKVSSFDYQEKSNIPSQMVKTTKLNCLGAALLGGTFLEELDISYLAVDLPDHASTILITSDGKWYRQDFTSGTAKTKRNYTEITPEIVENKQERIKLQEKKEGVLVLNWNPYSHIIGQMLVYISSPEAAFHSLIHSNQGSSFYDNHNFSMAEKKYKKSLQIQENNAKFYSRLAATLSALEKYEEAIDCYQKAIELDPNYALAYNNLGNTLSALEKYEEAIDCYQKAIELDPNYIHAYNNLAATLSALEKYEDAIDCYQKAIGLDPNYAKAYYNLGEVFGKLKKYPEAIHAYQNFIQFADQKDKAWVEVARKEVEKLQEMRLADEE